MKKALAYKKLSRANDEITEVLENILSEELRKGNQSPKLDKLIEAVENAADYTQAAMALFEGV